MNLPNSSQGMMSAIAAAVTPVVMISANAILISGISSKHSAMADRLRGLAAEWRSGAPSAVRKRSIAAQIRLLNLRIDWISRAHVLLYAGTVCFLAMVLVIALSTMGESWAVVSVLLLLAGVLLTLIAMAFELIELSRAKSTIHLESSDVLSELDE